MATAMERYLRSERDREEREAADLQDEAVRLARRALESAIRAARGDPAQFAAILAQAGTAAGQVAAARVTAGGAGAYRRGMDVGRRLVQEAKR